MTVSEKLSTLKQVVYDFGCLFRPKAIFIFAFVSRKGIGYERFNWGDDINIWMIEEISDLKVLLFNRSRVFPRFVHRVYSCIGSYLGQSYGRHLDVWGSGFISETDRLKIQPHRVYSVRGPLTRQKLLEQGVDCPAIFGDPALLVSKYYHPRIEKKFKYGIIPHYVDEDNSIIRALRFREDVLIISMSHYNHWHDIPDAICSCERILSSSLHGLIVSDSYGIPNVWVRFSDKIVGGSFKYWDYFKSVDREAQQPVVINQLSDIDSVLMDDSLYGCAKSIDFDAIIGACPFKSHLKEFKGA